MYLIFLIGEFLSINDSVDFLFEGVNITPSPHYITPRVPVKCFFLFADDFDVCSAYISGVETDDDGRKETGRGKRKPVPNRRYILTEDGKCDMYRCRLHNIL